MDNSDVAARHSLTEGLCSLKNCHLMELQSRISVTPPGGVSMNQRLLSVVDNSCSALFP